MLLALAMFCSYIFMDILSPIKDLMQSERGWDSLAFGTMQGSETFLNVFVFFLIFAGIILVPGTDSYRLREAGAEGVAVYSGTRYLLTEEFRLTEQDLLALFERHGYDLVLLEGFKSSGWPKIEVVRSAISDAPVSFQPLAVVGDIPGADFDLNDIPALADWIEAQMPAL